MTSTKRKKAKQKRSPKAFAKVASPPPPPLPSPLPPSVGTFSDVVLKNAKGEIRTEHLAALERVREIISTERLTCL